MLDKENENDNEISDVIVVDNTAELNKAVCERDKENHKKRKIKLLRHHHKRHRNHKDDSEIEMMKRKAILI
jgi:hypothetical protein